MRLRPALFTVCLAAFLFVSFGAVSAQDRKTLNSSTGEDQSMMRALLEEVRLLRQEMHRANLQLYQTQVILARLRIQQEHVDRLSRQLDVTRNELETLKQAVTQLTERLKDAEEKMNSDPDEDTRTQARLVVKDLQLELKLQREREQAKRESENQLTAQLQVEQSKLTELNERLDVLEREVLNSDKLAPQLERH